MREFQGELHVQVCYALPNRQTLCDLSIPTGATIQIAILRSGLLQIFPEIDLTTCRVGIHGKLKPLDAALRDGDRIEIYRPLIADPKESRRKRAAKKDDKGTR